MKQSILIIGADRKWEEEELLRAAKATGYTARILDAHRLLIRLNESGAELFYEQQNITPLFKKSRIIFRRTRGTQEKMITLSLLAKHWGIPFTDTVASVMSNLNKSISMPSVHLKGKIRHIKTAFLCRGEAFDFEAFDFHFPLLVKPVHGRHGEGIKTIRNEKNLSNVLKWNRKAIMIQPFLEIESEYRIFVVGGKALGAIRKIPKKGSVIANYAAGAQFVPAIPDEKVIQEAITICEEQYIDIGGVDVAQVGKHFYLLEVNRCPEFQAFSATTGIDVAKKITEFLIQKAS
ncbi:hypothetical protein COY07_03060 [Candidatus Peregrinibacteria bacterium CG_4_10_14_0_2_um_filter_43_11]|nr:MAG: hypothetical protein COY07_03060 [Candidatus Peregrinibacteria bacterium CG_4_10_14_0_2_um_filter_43_11]